MVSESSIFPARFGSVVVAHGSSVAVGAPYALPASAWDRGGVAADAAHSTWPTIASSAGIGTVTIFVMVAGTVVADVGNDTIHSCAASNGRSASGSSNNDCAGDDGVGDAMWVLHTTLSSTVPTPGAAFGAALALDGGSLVVGEPGASGGGGGITWNFETGDLRGWTATGSAFSRQPTLDDNSRARQSYTSRVRRLPPVAAGQEGRFWIGSFEARPSAQSSHSIDVGAWLNGTDCSGLQQCSAAPPGTAQGDGPQGSLTSRPFAIAGDSISFLIGGGCDVLTTFVELQIDGNARTRRATGDCRESMQRVAWDVHLDVGRTGVIRIVDASSTVPWGHISVDDFRFSWLSQEAMARSGGFVEGHGAGAAHFYILNAAITPDYGPGAQVTTQSPMSPDPGGFAYSTGVSKSELPSLGAAQSKPRFAESRSRRCDVIAMQSLLLCTWELSSVLRAADGRPGSSFGGAVAVDDSTGIALVASTGSFASASAAHENCSAAEDTTAVTLDEPGVDMAVSLSFSDAWIMETVTPAPALLQTSHSLYHSYTFKRPHATAHRGVFGRAGSRGRIVKTCHSGAKNSLQFGRHGVAVVRAEPEILSAGVVVRPRSWPSVTSDAGVLWLLQPHHVADTQTVGAILAGATAFLVTAAGDMWTFDVGAPTHITLDGRNWLSPSDMGAVTHNGRTATYVVAASGEVIKAYTVSRMGQCGQFNAEAIVPVYMRALGASRTSLVVDFATEDVTAHGTSPRVAALCATRNRNHRGAPPDNSKDNSEHVARGSQCDDFDFVHQAGRIVFDAGIVRVDVIIPLLECTSHTRCFGTRVFLLRLMSPGGMRWSGVGAAVTVRLTDASQGMFRTEGNCSSSGA